MVPVVAGAELDGSDVEVALKVNLPPVASCGAARVPAVAGMRAEALSDCQRQALFLLASIFFNAYFNASFSMHILNDLL